MATSARDICNNDNVRSVNLWQWDQTDVQRRRRKKRTTERTIRRQPVKHWQYLQSHNDHGKLNTGFLAFGSRYPIAWNNPYTEYRRMTICNTNRIRYETQVCVCVGAIVCVCVYDCVWVGGDVYACLFVCVRVLVRAHVCGYKIRSSVEHANQKPSHFPMFRLSGRACTSARFSHSFIPPPRPPVFPSKRSTEKNLKSHLKTILKDLNFLKSRIIRCLK